MIQRLYRNFRRALWANAFAGRLRDYGVDGCDDAAELVYLHGPYSSDPRNATDVADEYFDDLTSDTEFA